MKSVVKKLVPLAGIVLMASCGNGNGKSDASGTFEADEVIVSAEATGKILQLNVEEGAALAKDMVIGKIDPTAIELQKEQAASSVEALGQKTNDASPQVSVLESQIVLQNRQVAVDEEQLRVLQKEQQRFQKLVAADAVPAKQLDDINGQVDVLEEKIKAGKTQLSVLQSQVNAQRRQVAIQNRGILSEKDPMEKKVAIIEDQPAVLDFEFAGIGRDLDAADVRQILQGVHREAQPPGVVQAAQADGGDGVHARRLRGRIGGVGRAASAKRPGYGRAAAMCCYVWSPPALPARRCPLPTANAC